MPEADMTDSPQATANVIVAPAKPRLLDWLPAIATILTMLGFVWTAATWVSQVQDNTRRIQTLEASDKARTDVLMQIDSRLSHIEGALERDRSK